MRYRWLAPIPLIFLVVLFLPQVLHGKVGDFQIARGEGPVDIEADQLYYERETQLYHAHGQVEVSRGGLSLRADHAQLNMVTKDVTAWGNVVLREGEDVLECERLEINLETRLGKIYKAKLFLKDQNFHITGREAEKLGENHYKVIEGSFTTCDAERPPWKFTAKELDVTLEGYGVVKGPVAYLENIPVLYLPWAIFPMRRERQTGILMPQVGYSEKFGPEIKTAFFWAISKDMDATLYFDWLGKRGFKEGLEFRYAFTRDTRGQATFYFIDDQEFDRNRYAFFIQHEQKFPYNFYLKGNINHVSDHEYIRDFDEDLPEGARLDSRSRRQLRSILFGGKNWDQYSLLAEGAVFNDLTRESNDETAQILPQVQFYAHPQLLFHTPLFFEMASSYTHFWREKGVVAHRGDLFPRLSYPVRLFNVLKLESAIGFRETLYRSDDDPTGRLDGWASRETFEAGADLSTEFFKVYDATLIKPISNLVKVSKWMHTIEPTVGYRYSPPVHQDDIPIFDEVDRLPFTSQITYGITQRLIGKPQQEGMSSGPFEYAKLKIFQSYSFGDPFRDATGKERRFSNIRGELWLKFNPFVSAHVDAELNPYRWDFDVINALLVLQDKRKDVFRVGYRYTKENVEAIHLDARVKVLDPLYLFGGFRYNFLNHWRVENIYGAEYQAQCWALGVMVQDKGRSPDGTQRKELKFQVYFNLLGIGSVGHKSYLMRP